MRVAGGVSATDDDAAYGGFDQQGIQQLAKLPAELPPCGTVPLESGPSAV